MININEKKSYKWIILFLSFSLMLVFAISLQFLPPIFDNISKDIPFSNKQAGLLMSSYSVLGIFLPFLVAILLNKLNLKTMVVASLILVMIGLIGFSLSNSYALLLIFRLISGAGATTLVVLSPLLVTLYFNKDNISTAMGIFNAAVPVGTVLSVNLFGYLGMSLNWRYIIWAIISFVVVILLFVLLFLITPSNNNNNEKSTSPNTKFNLGLSLLSLGIIWMIANSQLLAYTTFGSQFFQMKELSLQKSSLLTSMIMLVSIF